MRHLLLSAENREKESQAENGDFRGPGSVPPLLQRGATKG